MKISGMFRVAAAGWAFVFAGAFVQPAASAANGVRIGPEDKMDDIVLKAAQVTPSPRQLPWQEIEFAAFIHFGMNTFTNREWGEGTEDPKLFNPTDLDARQWAAACKSAGMRLLILTAKHHDGFCLWPSKYTEHSVKNSPWKDGKGDVVREAADACREAGLRFGVYLSPWDRHERTYGDSPAYNAHFMDQLRELLTGYGEIAEVWFDGACGEGPNGKRQEYDWPAFYRVVRELQPNAVIAICGPDVRWCGNEAGTCRESEWSVVPVTGLPDDPSRIETALGSCDAMAKDLGSREALTLAAQKGARLIWYPAEVDTSIRPGWFYHPAEDAKVKSLEHLLDVYYGSVGGNAQLLLNVPPDRRGRIHENDAARLREIGAVLTATFAHNLAAGAQAKASAVRGNDSTHAPDKTIDGDKDSYWTTNDGETAATIEYDLGKPQTFNRALLQEQTKVGQRVEEFFLDACEGTDWKPVTHGTTIGYKRLLRFDDVTAQRVRVRITQSRLCPTLSNFGLFHEPGLVAAPAIERDKKGMVSLFAQPGIEIRYWIDDGSTPSSSSQKYEQPFPLQQGGAIKAMAIPPDGVRYPVAGDSTMSQAEFEPIKRHAAARKTTERPAKTAGWETLQPDIAQVRVTRTSETLPLSDQGNIGQWERYDPVWDEFDGDALDPAKWWPINPTWKGRQPGLFCAGNVTVSDGKLHLAMRKEEPREMLRREGYHTYTSAAVQTKGTFRYGYFEVKAKPMRSAGSSSFWFYDAKTDWWTEIDVFEIGGGAPGYERKVNMNLHVMHTPMTKEHFEVQSTWVAPFDLAEDYHVYGLEWDEREIKFYFDGVLLRRGPNTDWHQPLTLNFDSETMPEWFGLPKDPDLPSTYSIEYIRAWKHPTQP